MVKNYMKKEKTNNYSKYFYCCPYIDYFVPQKIHILNYSIGEPPQKYTILTDL